MVIFCSQKLSHFRGVGAKLEVVRQILKLSASFMIRTGAKCSYICSYLKLPKATQLPKAAHARGVWGHAPQENFEF